MTSALVRSRLTVCLLGFELLFIILFGVFVKYDPRADATAKKNSLDPKNGGASHSDNDVPRYYAAFQDVHVMIFIGFGYLMTFLKRYGYGSVGFTFLLGAFVIQWATLVIGFFDMEHGKITVSLESMLTADFAAAAVLISFGAVLGKLNPLQLIIMSLFEIAFFRANEWIGVHLFKAVDVGGSMFVHAFGAYFGLAVARVTWKKDVTKSEAEARNAPVYHSDLFAMIGTVFLWLFWPSFNSALAPGDDQHRAILNTYFSLAACCVVTFAMSAVLDKEGKFDMVHIQNATLAGGVAVGTSADMMTNPYGALIIGSLAGVLSTLGFKYLTPFLAGRLKIHDTCGVNNLHGMPGVFSGIVGAIFAGLASTAQYGNSLYQIFPARAPLQNSTELLGIQTDLSIIAGEDRSAGVQAGMQLAALALTLAIAVFTGVATGFFLRLPFLDPPTSSAMFNDEPYWGSPSEGFPKEEVSERFNGGEGKELQRLTPAENEDGAAVA